MSRSRSLIRRVRTSVGRAFGTTVVVGTVIVGAAGLAGVATPAGAAGYSHPLVAPQMEQDVAALMNQMRVDQGLAPLDLIVTTNGAANPQLEAWRNCLLELNMSTLLQSNSLTHDGGKTCGPSRTAAVPGEQILAASWISGSNRGANPVQTATSWLGSPPHTKWLMSPNASSMMVYAACFEANNASYLIIGATLLDSNGNWPSPNASSAAPSTQGSVYDPAYYHACPKAGSSALIQPSKARPGTQTTPLPGTVAAARSLSEVLAASDYSTKDAETLRLYRAFFDRDPDVTGAAYWITQARLGVAADGLAWGFAASDEFRNLYGQVDDSRFLGVMFQNMLGRAPDPAGFRYWLNEMQVKGLDKHEVVRWVTANDEFARKYPFSPAR